MKKTFVKLKFIKSLFKVLLKTQGIKLVIQTKCVKLTKIYYIVKLSIKHQSNTKIINYVFKKCVFKLALVCLRLKIKVA